MSEKLIEEKKRNDLVELIRKEYRIGRVVLSTIEGIVSYDIDALVSQPVDGLLYDLNRDMVTCLAWISQPDSEIMWINNCASGIIIEYLCRQRDSLRAELDEWKADAEMLAELVEAQRNAYDLMGCDGVTGITDEGYKKLECALIAHTALVEKEKNNE